MAESAASDFAPVRLTLRDGRSVTVRALRQDDADAMRSAIDHVSEEARYNRFMRAVKVTSANIGRTVLPPGERERSLVAVSGQGVDEAIVGGARYVRGTDSETCEFAVTVTDEWRGAGLASGLMRALIRDAAARGLKRMEGYALTTNAPMLDLARRLDFEVGASDEGPSVKRVHLDLANTDTNGRMRR